MQKIEITTLGNLAVTCDGQVVEDFVSTKTTLLLVYLVMNPGEHTREKLAALLWSDTSDAQALKNLRTVLSSLRQRLPDAVIAERKTVAIAENAHIWLDAVAFETEHDAIAAESSAVNPLGTMMRLAELYKGDFLSDIRIKQAEAFDEWAYARQQNLCDRYARLLFEITDLALEQRSYEVGLQYARKLIALNPYWEAAQRQLMRLLFFSDRANDALRHYEEFAQLLDEELLTVPEEETIALYEQIRTGKLEVQSRLTITLPDTLYVEPANDVEYAQRMLDTPQCRLLTVLGISGVGKTTFAWHVAYTRQHLYRDGACIVSLSEAKSEAEIPLFIARAVGLNAATDTVTDGFRSAVLDHLKPLNALLVLDNFEHLLPEVGFIQELLEAAPEVQLIITSQFQLNLYREWLLPLKGLDVPDGTAENPQDCETVKLFALTAQRVNPRFNLADTVAEVAQICQLIDGLPLAVVIAAGWVQYMSPTEILDMVRGNVMEMQTIHRDLPARHQSFRSLLDSILQHLSPAEQQALISLAIFNGSFDRAAALAVARVMMPTFISLVDKSLVQQLDDFRYTLHSLVRQVLKERLRASDFYGDVVTRYTDHFEAWCQDFYAQNLPAHEILNAIDVEHHNIWWLEHACEARKQRYFLAIAPALSEYWLNRGYQHQGVLEILEAAIANADLPAGNRASGAAEYIFICVGVGQYDRVHAIKETGLQLAREAGAPYVLARILRSLVELAAIQGQHDLAQGYLKEVIDLSPAAEHGDNPRLERLLTSAYGELGVIMMDMGNYAEAQHYLGGALTRYAAAGDRLRVAVINSNLGVIALKEKDYDRAYTLFSEALDTAREAKHDTLALVFASNVGEVAMYQENYGEAQALFAEALILAQRIGRKTSIINILEQVAQLAIISAQRGDPALYGVAAQILGFVATLREKSDLPVLPRDAEEHAQRLAVVQQNLPDTYAHLFQSGAMMGLPTVVQIVQALEIPPLSASH